MRRHPFVPNLLLPIDADRVRATQSGGEMTGPAETTAMQRAIALAASVLGTTNPNPAVGAVVLGPSGDVVGVGATEPVGGRHAEVVALADAGARARGGTLVVTLEPCRHTGRTGPCTDAVLAAGIARVIFAAPDPSPAAGGGGAILRERGIDVTAGLLAEPARALMQPWLTSVERGRPHITWKYAATLDGRTAAADGTSRWITGAAARTDAHRERSLVDAVLVGVGTVLADDPSLTVRDHPATRQPVRVVADSAARTPSTARILDRSAPTVIAVTAAAPTERLDALRACGAEVIVVPATDNGVDPVALVSLMFAREVHSVLLEGGARLAASFVRCLVDRVVGYHAPMLLGAGAPVVAPLDRESIDAALRLQLDDVVRLDDDVKIVARIGAGEEA